MDRRLTVLLAVVALVACGDDSGGGTPDGAAPTPDASSPVPDSAVPDARRTPSACTDGVDCFCDTVASAITDNVIFCEDFEDPAYDDGTGDGWNAVYPSTYWDCNGGNTTGQTGEGTDPEDCYNVVANDACDVDGETNCVLDGNQSLGHKFDEGYTHGIFGDMSFGPAQSFGLTMAMKFSTNFVRGGGPGFKHNQWNPEGSHSFFAGQDTCAAWAIEEIDGVPNVCVQSSPTPTGFLDRCSDDPHTPGPSFNDLIWSRNLHFEEAPVVTDMECNLGRIFTTDTQGAFWAPDQSSFPGGTFDWELGTWACLRMKITGFGTSETTVQMWWQFAEDPVESPIIDFAGLDTSRLDGAKELKSIRWDNYFNGMQGDEACGYGSTAYPCVYEGLPRAYRYEDNLVVTDGEPVSCAAIGF